MVEKSEIALVLWEVTCLKPTRTTNPEYKFLYIDEGDDPSFYCDGCGEEWNHLHGVPTATVTQAQCWRCKGKGKLKLFDNPERKCFTCDGTGIQKFDHIKRCVGRVGKEDLRKLAEQDPRDWHDYT